MNCISSLEVSLDQAGNGSINSDLLLASTNNCTGAKVITIITQNGEVITNGTLNCSHIGLTSTAQITDLASQLSCWSIISVIDNSPPKIFDCVNQEVFCNSFTSVDSIGTPTFEDNCGTAFTASFVDETIEQPCNDIVVKIINRIWLVTDNNGNQSSQCNQEIRIKPIDINDVIFPEDINVDCETPNTSPTATGFPTFNGANVDNNICQTAVDFSDITTPLCGTTFGILRTWTVFDWCSNNQVNHIQKIEVIDTIPPTFQNAEDTLFFSVSGPLSCTADVSMINLNMSDNCNAFTITYDWEFSNNHTEVPIGVYSVTATATDECGNQNMHDFFIEVIDNFEPIAICESDFIINLDESGMFVLEANLFNNSSTDNCGIADALISTGQAFAPSILIDCDQLGTPITISLLIVDQAGNTSECSAEISIMDNSLPTITCPSDITINCFQDPNNLSLTGEPIVMDNCIAYTPIFSDSLDLTICNSGTIHRTFTVVENETALTCNQKITLEIDIPSVEFPEDITVECGQKNNFDLVGRPNVTAMCPGFIVDNNDERSVAENCNIITTRTWKVFDNCLDTIYRGEQIVTEFDTLDPVLIQPAQNISINCQPGDLESLDNWIETNGGAIVEDNCTEEVIWTNNFGTFDLICGNMGSTAVTFTATDDCGNSVSTSANFMTIDTLRPNFVILPANVIITCESDIQQQIDDYLSTNGGAIGADLCSEVMIVSELLDEIEAPCDTLRVMTTVTDQCGLFTTAFSTIIILDETPPVILTPPMDIAISCIGNVTDDIEDWVNSNGGGIAQDECGTHTWTNNFNLENSVCGSPVPVIFTATDECGNSISATANYMIVDDTPPTIIEPAMDISVECNGLGNEEDIMDYLDNNGFSVVTDECSDLVWTNNFEQIDTLCAISGFAEITFTATDICGNQSMTTGTITIEDTEPPFTLTPVQEFVVECDGFGNILAFNTWVQANGNIAIDDICGDVEFSFDFNTLNVLCANAGNVLTVFVARDECGNPTNLITNFIIEDTTPPNINCPDDLVVVDANLDCEEFIILPPTTASDLCNGTLFFSYEIDFNSDGTSDIFETGNNASGFYPLGTHTVIYLVEDECGNIGSCEQVIRVVDEAGIGRICLETFLLGIDASGTATLNPTDLTSACNTGTNTISQTNFTCDDCGMNQVILTNTSATGNVTTCITNVFVCDLSNNCADCVSCAGAGLAVGGKIDTENNIPVEAVALNIDGFNPEVLTNVTGEYSFEGISNESYNIIPFKNDEPTNGVTTIDLIAIQRHILGIATLESPYQKIAADANNSGSITTLDIVDIQQVVLQIKNEFTNNTSWRFVERDFNFPDYNNPFASVFPEHISINGLTTPQLNNDFVAVKIGDVNQTFNMGREIFTKNNTDNLFINIEDKLVQEGETVAIKFEIDENISISGYQFTIGFDPTRFEFIEVDNFGLENLNSQNFGLTKIEEGLLLVNWICQEDLKILDNKDWLFNLKLKAKRETKLVNNIWIQNDPLLNEVYVNEENKFFDVYQFKLKFLSEHIDGGIFINEESIRFHNVPNPFDESTLIKFYLPIAGKIEFDIYDPAGKKIWSHNQNYEAGDHEMEVSGNTFNNDGIYFCTLRSSYGNHTIKLVRIKNY